jgi:hypothetical protein
MQSETSHLERVKLKYIHPTQATVGFEAVREKRQRWENLGRKERNDFLSEHWFPGVLGPDGDPYIVDHHHLARALSEFNVKTVRIVLLADLAKLESDEFWMVMDHRNWVHPYNAAGHRIDFDKLPTSIDELKDDPYRSIAAQVAKMGGYAKNTLPYEEFLWADFFRRRIPLSNRKKVPQTVYAAALALAKDSQAKHLPGWSGIDSPSK